MDLDIELVVADHAQKLLLKACHFTASDIHMMPTEKHYTVKFRKFGKLIDAGDFPEALGTRIISYFKFLSSIDISEKRKPQSGAFSQLIQETPYSFRISTLPSIFNKESLVIRIIKQNMSESLMSLCYFSEQANQLYALAQKRQGLLLLTGATGSGKTTTLYSMVNYCQEKLARHVITLEDPVETPFKDLLQIQINERAGVTYAAGLKAILRHSPDVIMIGEIRDKETAKIAVQASLTGHLVLATVHAKNTVNCIYRMLDLSVSIEELRQTLIAVVAQTLVMNDEADERKAVFELLQSPHLDEAILQTIRKQSYSLPQPLTFAEMLKRTRKDVGYEDVFT